MVMCAWVLWMAFQSTPPRGGRRIIVTDSATIFKVSIHAPAWGATGGLVFVDFFSSVSIHAPAWGATVCLGTLDGKPLVSIHAPAWGATPY